MPAKKFQLLSNQAKKINNWKYIYIGKDWASKLNCKIEFLVPYNRHQNCLDKSMLSIECILHSQAISFQILLYRLFLWFPLPILLPFPSYFKLHNLMYWGSDILVNDKTIPPQTALHYHIFDLCSKTHHILKNISQHPLSPHKSSWSNS